MKFKKIDCINAVLTEPLKSGEWNFGYNDTCSVCAVGAIFRHCQDINNTNVISDLMDNIGNHMSVTYLGDVEEHLHLGRYLHALSCFFEHMKRDIHFDEPTTLNDRYSLVHFIEAFFPDEFEYTRN